MLIDIDLRSPVHATAPIPLATSVHTPPGAAPQMQGAGGASHRRGSTPPPHKLPSPALSKSASSTGAPPGPTAQSASAAAAAAGAPPAANAGGGGATRRQRKSAATASALPPAVLDAAVPPISVLIVEDNAINLKVLETFMKKLRVRTHTAVNGRIAVSKWRELGGVHLVLMDIRLPVMNGLDATKEIRRLERVNGVGVLADKMDEGRDAAGEEADAPEREKRDERDRLKNPELFKSPVIVVALTASNLQSDRDEALAAGCNDFLTKVSSRSLFRAVGVFPAAIACAASH